MEGSYLAQILFSRHEADLRAWYRDEIEDLERNHISTWSTSLLSYMLSFIELKDVRRVMLVCRQWYNASRGRDFWKRHIQRRMNALCPQELKRPLVFDNFIFAGVYEKSLREQVEWLFKTEKREAHVFKVSDAYYFQRYSNPNYISEWQFALDGSFDCASYYQGNFITKYWNEDGTVIVIDDKNRCLITQYNNGKPCDKTQVICKQWLTLAGNIWDGEGWTVSTNIFIHGKGTWTFPDGSTLTGDNVAFDGLPHGTGVDENGKTVTYFAGSRVDAGVEEEMEPTKKRTKY